MRQLDTEVFEVAADCKTAKRLDLPGPRDVPAEHREHGPDSEAGQAGAGPHVGLVQVQGGVHQLRHIIIRPETVEEFPDPSGGEVRCGGTSQHRRHSGRRGAPG